MARIIVVGDEDDNPNTGGDGAGLNGDGGGDVILDTIGDTQVTVNRGTPDVDIHASKFITGGAQITIGNAPEAIVIGGGAGGAAASELASELGVDGVSLSEREAAEINEGRATEQANGVDPTTIDPLEYGDGGIPTARAGNRSPVIIGDSQASGVQNAPGSENSTSPSPSPQPSNADGEFIKWLPHVDSRVKPQVVKNLEAVSKSVGYQLQVTSGYRSPAYNRRVGGATNSQHTQGNATDIVQRGLTASQRAAFIQAAIDAGFNGIGVYNTFTHVDIGRGTGKVAWGSSGSRSSLPSYPWAQEVLKRNGFPYK